MASAKQIQNLDAIFNPQSVAIIGASQDVHKIGHVILRNFLDSGFDGKIYAVNPNHERVMGVRCLPRASDAPEKVDCALIAVPQPLVQPALEDAVKAGARGAVVIAGGYSEVGNIDAEKKLVDYANKHHLALIGPNCMGVLNPSMKVDSVFLPISKMGRPKNGRISFITQSGAVGGCVVDLAARAGMCMSKFVSYGNGSVINETDLIQYLSKDDSTQVLISYLEGVRNGPAFMQAAKAFTSRKPFVVLKAGKTALGAQAAASHTATLAGAYEVYSAAFAQCGIIEARTLEELFDLSKIFMMPKECMENARGHALTARLASGAAHPSAHGHPSSTHLHWPRLAILTNGGGNGVLAADAISDEGLQLSPFSPASQRALASMLPPYTNLRNPLDLIGDADAERYRKALDILMADSTVDALVVIVLFQTAALDSTIIGVLTKAAETKAKPMVVVSTGGEYTEVQRRILDSKGIPTFASPTAAVHALAQYMHYWEYRKQG